MSRSKYPIRSKVTGFDDLPDGADRMVSVMRGRNDYNIAAPPSPDSVEFADMRARWLVMRGQVEDGIWPDQWFEHLGVDPEPPRVFAKFGVTRDDPRAAAMLVHHGMDHPQDLHAEYMEYFGGIPPLKLTQSERKPEQFGVDWLGARWLDAEVARNVYRAAIDGGQCKYFFVYGRPEQVFDAGRLVTVYEAPEHPSYPAWHATSDGAIFQTWLEYVDLDEATIEEFRHWAVHHCLYRCLGGVHWAFDCLAGFDLARRVVTATR